MRRSRRSSLIHLLRPQIGDYFPSTCHVSCSVKTNQSVPRGRVFLISKSARFNTFWMRLVALFSVQFIVILSATRMWLRVVKRAVTSRTILESDGGRPTASDHEQARSDDKESLDQIGFPAAMPLRFKICSSFNHRHNSKSGAAKKGPNPIPSS